MRRSASIPRMPAMHRRRRARGLTLIELLLFIVVVGIALAAMLKVFVTATTFSTDPMVRRQQLAIAESLLREVELMPFTWCDPTDANVETASTATLSPTNGCASLVEAPGPESGQTRDGPSNFFNNVNDYNGFAMTGIRDVTNTAVAGLSGYSASVVVSAAALDNIPAAGDALKITVTVSGPDSSNVSLQGWRTRYAPNAPD
ncbi:MSHA pilin protein MshD [Pelomonas saccharophila]|uniref:MSHA pilin protein MshD n=1 Tax=Roseateles saccharophilus TaxID=304 RepID=A0ABU1YF69_ROSSA|nr:prepilin-type N-terminal cleavage/methylation domain-containing protein [Roseateles saccharophilus]MDR7267499.1 MSHA pilin protein MshD [Roseateles saccharophilus]